MPASKQLLKSETYINHCLTQCQGAKESQHIKGDSFSNKDIEIGLLLLVVKR